MADRDTLFFTALFKDAYLLCFGNDLKNPLTETESKLFCNQVLEQTGLSIGWKSVKNYSLFIIDPASGKTENPSAATLDTLARYVLRAPYTTELRRKNDESHYPYWFLYKERHARTIKKRVPKKWLAGIIVFIGGIGVIILMVVYIKKITMPLQFTDDFSSVGNSTFASKGWFVKAPDTAYWNKRAENPGQLTLFTLNGDNWPDPKAKPVIRNLLLRSIPYDCFTTEVHLVDFIPKEEWQQAGILLLEDTSITDKSIRLSIAFNDYFGGYHKPQEILIQVITSLGEGFGKPEEIAHKPIFYLDTLNQNPALTGNLHNSALRIEKHGKRFRLLYAGGVTDNTAFKEIATLDFDMEPRYIGLFAIKGFVASPTIIPAHFTFFKLAKSDCNE